MTVGLAPADTGSSQPTSRVRTALTIVSFAALTLVFGLAHLLRRAPFSGYDEAAHIDYAWKLAHGSLPYPGSLISPEILDLWACVGQDNVSLPPCDSGAPASSFPAEGENYLMHPPVYYLFPALTGRVAMLLGGDFLDGARAGSLVWLFLGMSLLYFALRTWNVRWSIAAPVAGVIPAIHLVMVASTTVNNDATAVAAGAAALAVGGRALVKGRVGFVIPLLVTALFAATKVLNTIPFLAIGIAVVIAAFAWPNRPIALTRWRAAAFAGSIVVATALVHVTWSAIRSARKIEGWTSPVAGVNTDTIQGLPIDEWMMTLFNGIRSVSYGPEWISTANGVDLAFATLLSALLLAAPIVGLLLWNRHEVRWYVPVAAGLAMLMLPLIIQLQTYVGSDGDQYFRLISIRYSVPTLPLLLASAAFVVESRKWIRSTWIFVGAGLAVSLGTIVLG